MKVIIFVLLVHVVFGSLYNLHDELSDLQWVDLTHGFEAGIPHFPLLLDGKYIKKLNMM